MENSSYEPFAVLLAGSLSSAALPPLIDAEQAAKMLGCSKEHVEELADRGKLPATKYGRGWVFVTAQLLHHVVEDCAKNMCPRNGAPRAARQAENKSVDAKRSGEEPLSAAGASLPLQPRGPAKKRGRPRHGVPDPSLQT